MAIFNIAVSPRTSMTYLTIGALVDVWTAIWYFMYGAHDRTTAFWLLGLFFTGLTLVILGMALRPHKGSVVATISPTVVSPNAVVPQGGAATGDGSMATGAATTNAGTTVASQSVPSTPPPPPATIPQQGQPTSAGVNR
jgi:hypothetical protein